MTLRPATPSDARAIAACVDAAYEHYVVRMGKRPGPMLENYDKVLRQHRAFVLDNEGDIVAAIVLIAGPSVRCSTWWPSRRSFRVVGWAGS